MAPSDKTRYESAGMQCDTVSDKIELLAAADLPRNPLSIDRADNRRNR